MYKSLVYQGEVVLGEVDIYPEVNNNNKNFKEIRISHFTQPSERCLPLAVLHTITSSGVCFKMESKTQQQDPLFHLHNLCFRENKVKIKIKIKIKIKKMREKKPLKPYDFGQNLKGLIALESMDKLTYDLTCILMLT